MVDVALPALWLDWCYATDTPVDHRDEDTLAQFVRQASPSRAMLGVLRPATQAPHTPAWPTTTTDNPTDLGVLLEHVSRRARDPLTDWITRLRLRRLAFAAVLIAPTGSGGAAMTRTDVVTLSPEQLHDLRPSIATTDAPTSCPSCPSCAVWSWLEGHPRRLVPPVGAGPRSPPTRPPSRPAPSSASRPGAGLARSPGPAAGHRPLGLPRPRTKPRTKSSTAFQLPATGSSERAQYSGQVLKQMEADKAAGKRVIAVVSTQKGTSVDRRRTVWHLRNRGIAPRIVTSAPLPESGTRPGEDFRLQSDGIGRWAALKAARETNTPVLDMRGIVARPMGHSGLYQGTSHGSPIYRTGSHVTVDWARRVLPWHVRSTLKI